MEYEYKIKWCPVCDQGWITIVKEKGSENLFLCCDECETEWTNPLDIDVSNGTNDFFGSIEKPSIEDVQKIGWDKYILKE
jgi:hypothetical protein